MFDSSERKRLYKEAKSFLKLRAARNRYVKNKRNEHTHPAPDARGGDTTKEKESEVVNA
jgi:hypothetical protein